MITELSQVILKFIYKQSELSPEMRDIYQYGIEITLSSALNIVLVMGFSMLIRDVLAGAIFLLLFVFVRSFTGGYHAPTYFKCNSIMLLTFLSVCLIYRNLSRLDIDLHIYVVLSLLNLFPIFTLSPVHNKHKSLSERQKKYNHIASIVISISLSVIALLLIMFELKYGVLIVITISSISFMMIIGTLLQRRECHES